MTEKKWDPRDYTVKEQLQNILDGHEVACSGNEVFKSNPDGSVSMYFPSSSKKGHGHVVFFSDNSFKLVHP